MSNAYDAEGPAEIDAYLRDHGWTRDPDEPELWRHPRLSALPSLTRTAARELQAEADADNESSRPHSVAGPNRVH